MSNFPPLTGYPFGPNDPLTHAAVNKISEYIQKAHNADQGSAHAPTDTSAWSGAEGFGWSFGDAFPFTGEVSVEGDGLTIKAASSGFVSLEAAVALDVYGPTTFKSGGASLVQWASGATATWLSGSSFTLASGVTASINAQVNVRGQIVIKASGGPGSLTIENGTTNTCAGIFFFLSGGEARFQSGSFITGAVHVTSGSVVLDTGAELTVGDPITLDPAVSWTRHATRVACTTRDTGVPQADADYFSPLFAGPSLHVTGGSASPVITIFEFDPPPDGALLSTVTIQSVFDDNPLGALAVATYEVVRYRGGLTGAASSLSSVTNDTHATDASDWNTVKTISVTVNASTFVDRSYRYGLRVTSAHLTGSGARCSMFFDIKATGTNGTITGK